MKENEKLVMVVDDEPTMCRILERILIGDGYSVVVAMDGEKTLKLFEEHHPDVVLLDLMLPGMSGHEICHKIKELSETTKIIYLSAKAPPNDPVKFRELKSEADAYIAKPASSKQILTVIEKVSENNPSLI